MSNKCGHFVSAEESISHVKELLSEFNIETNKLNKILYIIEMHDNKDTSEQIPIELKILQDADTLDALGKRGLMRTLKYCKDKNIPIYNANYSLNYDQYIPNINPISTTHYVYRTMLPKAKYLKTKTAQKIAENQTKILTKFVNKNIKKYDLIIE